MKKLIYVWLFAFLGALVGFVIHGLLESWYIGKLLEDYAKYGRGITWDDWQLLHDVIATGLIIGGGLLGHRAGKKWWQRIYVEQPEWFKKRRFRLWGM